MPEHVGKKQKVVLTQYEQLAALTTIVADTGEIAQIKKFAPTDATTNPSLIYKASSAPEHQDLVEDALAYGKALEGVFRVRAGIDVCEGRPREVAAFLSRQPTQVLWHFVRLRMEPPTNASRPL